MRQNETFCMIAPIKPIRAEYIWPEAIHLLTCSLKFVDGVVIVAPIIIVLPKVINDPIVPLINHFSRYNSPNILSTLGGLFKFDGATFSVS